MADHYTNYSVLLPLPESEELKARIPEWVRTHQEMAEFTREHFKEEWVDIYNTGFMVDPSSTHVWVAGDGEGSAEAAANLIQLYLDDMEIEGGVLMCIAWYCSKPRINEAGGAAVVITRDDQLWITAEEAALNLAKLGVVEILN